MAQDIIELRTGQFSAVFISINSSSLTAIKRALTKKSKTSPSLFKNIEVILQFNPMLEKVNNRTKSTACRISPSRHWGCRLAKSSTKRINFNRRFTDSRQH